MTRDSSRVPLSAAEADTDGLDEDQARLVRLSACAKVAVTAGPGCGKTFAAAHRLLRIISEQDDDDMPVLVVSFSRAACHAIRSASWKFGCRAGVEFRTIDGWASSMVFRVNGTRSADGFDEGIVAAGAILDNDIQIGRYRHVIVDEAQDVFGLRRDLILRLLERSTGGWTVLGDEAQKIFEFDNDENDPDQPSLLEVLISRAGPDSGIDRILLATDHRSTTAELRELRLMGSRLRIGEFRYGDVTELWDAYMELPSYRFDLANAGDVDLLCRFAKSWADGPAGNAILVRRRSELLDLVGVFGKGNVEFRVPRGKSDRVLPAWVANLGGASSADEIRALLPVGMDAEMVIAGLGYPVINRGVFRSELLVQLLQSGLQPEFLMQDVTRGLSASTVHRVKGLEYATVGLANLKHPESPRGKAGYVDPIEESRVLFVGMTRASHELFRFELVGNSRYKKLVGAADRLIRIHPGRTAKPIGIELKASDIIYSRRVDAGDELSLVRSATTASDHPHYLLYSDRRNEAVGFARDAFGHAVARTWPGGLPGRFVGLCKVGDQTVVLRDDSTRTPSRRSLAVAPVFAGVLTPTGDSN